MSALKIYITTGQENRERKKKRERERESIKEG